ncbi:AAA family ATPase [Vibrio parahaemolyticus]|nr:AAA family ATPase [Vibrio parahaemolyticus]ELB2106593.1 AAA family ATPase [Vibrio parahaemolyticus]
MIDSIFVDNFKQFCSFKLENLNRVNVISGSNNTGKSTILESLFFFYDRGTADNIFKQLGFRGINSIKIDKNPLWSPLFNDFDIKKTITIRVTDSGQTYEAKYSHEDNFQGEISSSQPKNERANVPVITKSSSVSALKSAYKQGRVSQGESFLYAGNEDNFHLTYKNLLLPKKRVVYVGSYTRNYAVDDANKYGELVVAGEDVLLLSLIQKLEPRVKSIVLATYNGEPSIYCDVGLKRRIPLSMMGEGIGKYFSIIVSLSYVDNSIICIDELENGIHYSLFPSILDAIEKIAIEKNNQVFITTHNHDLLKGLNMHLKNSNSKSFEYIRIDRKGEKYLPKYYDSELISSAIDSDWEIR